MMNVVLRKGDLRNVLQVPLSSTWVGPAALAIFFVGYLLVMLEERLGLRKSKPMLAAAALIWGVIAIGCLQQHANHLAEEAIRHAFLEYAELFFFLLVAMTYVDALMERGVFEHLRDWLVARGLTYRGVFWTTGILAFCISPIADNLTTALILAAVVLAVGEGQPRFVTLSCIGIVVAANAGGAFSPFGDITTLMVWQKGKLAFEEFFALVVPAVVNYLVPALIMSPALPRGRPLPAAERAPALKVGGLTILWLFGLTIVTAVCFHRYLLIPPVFGMMAGLAYLKLYGFYLRRQAHGLGADDQGLPSALEADPYDFDVFERIAGAEWDTLFFFYGIIMAMGGLGFIGYLDLLSTTLYGELGTTGANVMVGVLSSVIDNIPVMFSVLSMNPDMPDEQWLLVTLTAGVGGSLLSIGSAAGVALMGQARGRYTFFKHLQWTPAIALGYAASIAVHLALN